MIKIYSLIFSILQTHRTGIPKVVWVGAGLIFLAAISMLIYFLTRLKKGEKEQEEDDWRTSRHSLFIEPVETQQPAEAISKPWSETATPASLDESEDVVVTASVPSETSVPPLSEPPPTAVHQQPVDQIELNRVAQDEERGTQLLGSQPPPSVDEGAVLADDVWAELETKQPAAPAEAAHIARVEQRARRETFEPPSIRPVAPRAPFEAPQIDRIVPRKTTASANEVRHKASTIPPGEAQSEPAIPASHFATPDAPVEQSVGALPAGARHKPGGSVLGLPVDSSRGPLILGEPQDRADVGIGALSNYGKDTGSEGGRGGMVALALVILIVGGSILAYLFLPSVHARVSSVVASLRGDPPPGPPAPPAVKPRAQIVFGVSEAVKNVVKGRGSIYNVSTEPLENLFVEVGLFRTPDGPPDTRTVPVTPNRLEPAQQGRFEFEYDGSRDKGYPAGYRALRVLSKDEEVKFTLPGQRAQ
jgi:hypothetical protein